jgi:hypothetical protein
MLLPERTAIAWFLLNCPDRSYRDAHQAVRDAASACRLIGWRDEEMIDLLAIAYAETGDFDSAVRYEEKALAIKGVKSDDAKRLQRHLDSFKLHNRCSHGALSPCSAAVIRWSGSEVPTITRVIREIGGVWCVSMAKFGCQVRRDLKK